MKIHDASRYVNCASRIRCQPNLNAPIFFFSHFRKKERKNFFRGIFELKKKNFKISIIANVTLTAAMANTVKTSG